MATNSAGIIEVSRERPDAYDEIVHVMNARPVERMRGLAVHLERDAFVLETIVHRAGAAHAAAGPAV
jgi:hypothetical protein